MFDLLDGTSDGAFRATDQGEICSRKLQTVCCAPKSSRYGATTI